MRIGGGEVEEPTLTRIHTCQSKQKKQQGEGEKGGRGERNSLPVGRAGEMRRQEKESRGVEERTMRRILLRPLEREECFIIFYFFLHGVSSVLGYSPTGETNCLLI